MQTIHRTSFLTTQVPPPECFGGQMAHLIDMQSRTGWALPGACQGEAEAWDANSLIWIEEAVGLVEARRRGLLVVAHGACHSLKEWSCVISYPSGVTVPGQGLLDVSESLADFGWLLLSRLPLVTAIGRGSTAVLVNRQVPGQERRLWLAAPSVSQASGGAGTERALPADANHRRPPPGRPAPAAASPAPAPGTHDQIETWVNEGGAGDDVPG